MKKRKAKVMTTREEMKRKRKLRRPGHSYIQGIEVGPATHSPFVISVGGYVLDPIAAQELAKYLIKFAAWAEQEQGNKKKK